MKQALADNKTKIAGIALVELLVLLQGVYCFRTISPSKSVLIFTVLALAAVAVLGFFVVRAQDRDDEADGACSETILQRCFVGALLVLSCVYMVVFPPNSVPDEMFHFQATYKFSDMLMGQEVDGFDVEVRSEDKQLFDEQRTKISATHYRAILPNVSLFADEEGSETITLWHDYSIADNPPQLKAPSVLGVTLGRVLNLGAYPTYYLGRLFSLLAFALLAYAAVRLAPFGKTIFMVASLLPMTLHLVSSYSYDVMLIGMSFLLTALCLRAIFGEGQIRWQLLAGIAVLVALIAPCKVIYAATALLVFFIPAKRFSSKKACLGFKLGVVALAILAIGALKATSLISLAGVDSSVASNGGEASALDSRGTETGTFYSLSDVLQNPLHIVMVYLNSFGANGWWYVETMVGYSLGWFQGEIVANDLITFSFIALLLLASMRSKDNETELPVLLRIAMVVVFFVVAVMAAASMLLGHTFSTENVIMGMQGRYLLPVLPVLLLALQNKKLVYQGNPAPVVLVCITALNLLYMNNVFAIALTL